MYTDFAYISLALVLILIPFLIPIRLKHPVLRKLRTIIAISLLVSTIITFTPDKAVNGAPVHKFGEPRIAYLECSYQISKQARFCDSGGLNSGDCYCSNPNALATIGHCYNISHNSQIDSFIQMCQGTYNITITRETFDESLINYTRFAKPLPQDNHLAPFPQILDHPLQTNDTIAALWRDAYDQFLGNYDRSVNYGGILVLYWIIVFLLAAVGNWSKLMFPQLHKRATDPITNWFRKSISLPATGGKRKTTEKPFMKFLDLLIPTRLESIVLFGFCLLCCFFAKHNIRYTPNDPLFGAKTPALLRYFAVRTSILSSSVMPLLILFGGRNNFLQWLTRWDYSTFIAFHRWISRIVFIMVVIHAVCYSLYMDPYLEHIRQPYLYWGIAATWAGGFIMIQGLLVLRRKWYEAFLIIHIILAFVFVGGAFAHVFDLYCMWFYYYALAVWLVDRIIRVGRLIAFGFPKAKVYLLADEALKIVVPKPDNWEAIPGGHAFIHFLQPSCFWQSHPFTYTMSVDPNESNIILFIKVKEGVTKRLYHYLKTHPGRSTEIRVAIEGSYGEETPASRADTAVFVAGGNGIPGIHAEVYDLAKHRLYLSANAKQVLKLIWVVREYKSLYWFYEELHSLRNTNIQTTIYVTKPELNSCLEEFDLRFPIDHHEFSDDEQNQVTNSGSGYVPHHNTANTDDEGEFDVDNDEAAQSHKPLLFNSTPLVDYNSISGSSPNKDKSTMPVEAVVNAIKRELPHIEFKEGRPSMNLLVSSSAKESVGSTAFVTCGHPVMVDELRGAVVANIGKNENKRVDYYEQLQVWA